MRDERAGGARRRRVPWMALLGALSAWLVVQNAAILLASPLPGAPATLIVARALLKAMVLLFGQALPAIALASGVGMLWLGGRRAAAPRAARHAARPAGGPEEARHA